MIEAAKQSPYFDIINSFYGIGEVLTTELLGELGDITRFDNHKQLIAFCGLDPTLYNQAKALMFMEQYLNEEINMQDGYYLILVDGS